MMRPTRRQLEALNSIRAFIKVNGFSPTLRELGGALGITSTNGVSELVAALERKGLIERTPGKARTIRPTSDVKKYDAAGLFKRAEVLHVAAVELRRIATHQAVRLAEINGVDAESFVAEFSWYADLADAAYQQHARRMSRTPFKLAADTGADPSSAPQGEPVPAGVSAIYRALTEERLLEALRELISVQYFTNCQNKFRAWAWDALSALAPEMANMDVNQAFSFVHPDGHAGDDDGLR